MAWCLYPIAGGPWQGLLIKIPSLTLERLLMPYGSLIAPFSRFHANHPFVNNSFFRLVK